MPTTDPAYLNKLYLLALCVWREARGESTHGKALVAQVIRNRVESPGWPDTYVGVITQPWQFSAFNRNDPNATRYPADADPSWRDSVRAAELVLTGEQPLTTANHYVVGTLYPQPSWADPTKITIREGAHVFYTL